MDEPLAKPRQGLLEHLRQVAGLGEEIAHRLELPLELRRRALLACWLHDVGKALPSFQSYIRAVRSLEQAKVGGASGARLRELEEETRLKRAQAFPHALASTIPTVVIEKNALGDPLLASAAVLSHHSPLTKELYAHRERPPLGGESLLEFLKVLVPELAYAGFIMPQEALLQIEGLLRQPPAGLLDDSAMGLRGRFRVLPRRGFAAVKTVLHLADWLASAGKLGADFLFLKNGKNQIQNHMCEKGYKLRDFQEKIQGTEGNVSLRAPTGVGKTEALLAWAGNAERILYLLPTQATVNAMWRRLREIYGEDAVGIAHGRASYLLRKEYEDEALDHRLFASVFAKPVVVATLDQYLMGHLHGRHWEERVTLSRHSAVILDEIHSYEPYTLGLLVEALERDPPRRLALASATLPDAIVNFLGKGILIEAEEELWSRKRYKLHIEDAPIEEALEDVVASAQSGQRVLVIVNTVPKAQALCKEFFQRGHSNTYLLHSRFTFRDRRDKEALVDEHGPGTILVATQVVEVSLDISYDILFTELAPLDALVQRMGRVNRAGKKPPVPVGIFLKWDKGSEWVYGPEILGLSASLLRGLPPEPTDGELRTVTNLLYNKVAEQEGYLKEIQEGRETLAYVQEVLGCYTMDLREDDLRKRFVTRRRGVVSVEVLPEVHLDEAYSMVERGEKWRLVELMVPVPVYWVFGFLKEWFYPSEDLGVYVTSLPYSRELGLEPPEAGDSPLGYQFID